MSELVGNGSKYTDDQRKEAAVQYAIKGSLSAIERDLDIPRTTMVAWKQSDWWHEVVDEVRHENKDAHISRYDELTREAQDLALDGLRSLDADDLKASDIKSLIIGACASTDKSRLLQGLATSIRNDSDTVKSLAAQFAKIRQDQHRIENSVVSTQSGESEPTTSKGDNE